MKWKIILASLVLIVGGVVGYGISFLFSRYKVESEMLIPITELSALDYPDDPAPLSTFYERYGSRYLRFVKNEDGHFDFYFESHNPHVASILLSDIDLSLFIPKIPTWLKGDGPLEKITLVEREWNRQQVRFEPMSSRLQISGGDGFEKTHLTQADLTRNCLNAGLFEIQLYTEEEGQNTLYYHGWFTVPLGHYKQVFEKANQVSYWKHWHRLEHWISPAGKKIDLENLREVFEETQADVVDTSLERVIAKGEQFNKLRTLTAKDVLVWKDFPEKRENVAFATFSPPGRYEVKNRWGNEYEKIASLQQIFIRKIKSPASDQFLNEIECRYKNTHTSGISRLLISGFDLAALPTLTTDNYPLGFQMPMGIALPPVYQNYNVLELAPPDKSSFFSVLIDEQNRWIDHHKVAIDGAILHKDINDPNFIHLYLLSYERHTLIAHYKFSVPSLL